MGEFSDFTNVVANLSLGGVGILVLIFGVTEVLKRLFNLDGKKVEILAVCLGFVFTAVAYGNSSGLLPEGAMVYINWVFYSITGAVAAMGYYKFVSERTSIKS